MGQLAVARVGNCNREMGLTITGHEIQVSGYHWVVSLIVEDYRGAASAVEIIDVVQQKKVLVSDFAAGRDRFDLFHKIRVAQIV